MIETYPYDKPHFEFTMREVDGQKTAMSFDANTWPKVMCYFVEFLRQSGFYIDKGRIKIDGKDVEDYRNEP